MIRRNPAASVPLVLLLGLAGCGDASRPAEAPKDATVAPAPNPVAAPASTSSPAPESRVALRLEPASATLTTDDFGIQFSALRTGDGGDLTSDAVWKVEPADLATVEGGYVRALRPGSGTIKAVGDGAEVAAELKVEETPRAWNFANKVVPLLTRAGCNTGGCHGRGEGQNGFHLSLFGYDPEGDHVAITRADGGRRLAPLDPAASLFLRKATGGVPHQGGARIKVDSPEYRMMLGWIKAGAPFDNEAGRKEGRLVSVRVEPERLDLPGPGKAQLRVLAVFEGGKTRDVTRQSSFKTNDDDTVVVDQQGRVELRKRGETDVIVRHGSKIVSARVGTVITPDLKFDFAALKRKNVVDEQLFKRLEALKVPPSPSAPDAVFLRRATLDLVGRQPRPQEVREFLADKSPNKREKLIDALLADRDFVRFWSIKLGDLLEITSARPELGNSAAYYQTWVTARLADNTPWNEVVTSLLTSVGDPMSRQGGPINYALEGPDPKVKAEKTAQRFLGLRIRCAQCHDHPFDVWTQDDYFGLAAIFAKVGRDAGSPGGQMATRPVVKVIPDAFVDHLRTKKPAEPRLLSGETLKVEKTEDPRKQLAAWMTSPTNPYFSRAAANWVWAQFFGKGIADPADDLSRANPPVHPELLDALARRFVEHKFDLKDLIRTIAVSEAYGLSSTTVPGNERDNRLFSHQTPRPLTAHQMADALAQVTDVPNRFRDRPNGTRAVEVTDPAAASTILETFGRCNRVNGCASVAVPSLSLRQSLLLIGGDVIESKVTHLNGYLAGLLDLKPSPEEIVENLYLRALCRPATEEELSHWTAELKNAGDLKEAAEDLFWALLNSREFAFNH